MTGAWFARRPSRIRPRTTNPAKARAPATPPATAAASERELTPGSPRNRGPASDFVGYSDFEDLEVFGGAADGARVQMVEDEPRTRMALLESGGRFPAHVAEDVARTRRLHDRHVGAIDQAVERSGRLGVARVSEDLVAGLDAVAVGTRRAVIEP